MNRRKPQNRPKASPPSKAVKRDARAPRLGMRAWREQHLYSLFSSLGRIAARPWTTLLTLLVMALALAMPLLLFLLLDNARQLGGDMQQAGAISVFMKPGESAEGLVLRARAMPSVAAVVLKTPADGLEELRGQPGFADAMKLLHDNPLPAVLVVTPRNASGSEGAMALVSELQASPGVDMVQYDYLWRERLDAILAAATRAASVLAGLLALAALLVVGNTVRLDILGRSDEIGVMQLLGASSGFVRRPFLYTGLWYGGFSALIALLVVLLVEFTLLTPLTNLVSSYDHRFALQALGWLPAIIALGGGALLGWLGAWLAASRHLAAGVPR